MKGISNYIGIGKYVIKYLIYLISCTLFLSLGRKVYESWYYNQKNKETPDNEKQDNILLKSLLKYLGYSFFIFGELIRKRISFKKKKKGI